MLEYRLDLPETGPVILCIGSHSDDIEIGCGGTLLKILRRHPMAHLHYVVYCAGGKRADEASAAIGRIVRKESKLSLHLFDYRDGYLPYEGGGPKEDLQDIAADVDPDVIFTHFREDAHQDHRLVSEITRNIFRDHAILEYEIPKFDGDLGRPNFYSVLSEQQLERKIQIIIDSFKTQSDKHWFTAETFRSIARIRGIEAGREHTYAEAFFVQKALFALD